jgi:hypothetical protein
LFTPPANAPRSHQGSAICDPGLGAPDQSGVQPFGAIGLLFRCSRFCRSSVGTTLRPATEAARTNEDCAPDRFRSRAQRRRRPRCRTAHSDRRSAGLTPTQSRLDRRVTVMGGVSQQKAMDKKEEGADNAPSFPAVPIGAQQSAPASCPYEPTHGQMKRVELMFRAGTGVDAPFAERLLEVARLSPCACACLPRLAPCRATGAPLALQEHHGDVNEALKAYVSVRTFQKLVEDASGLDASDEHALFYLKVARSSACSCGCVPRLGCARAADL